MTISTPGGSDPEISRSFFFTPEMTFSAFKPYRMTTTPATVSPVPFHSATPCRISGPNATLPRSRTSTGVPFLFPTGTVSRSLSDLR